MRKPFLAVPYSPFSFFAPGAGGSNERKKLFSAGLQRSSTIPAQPASFMASFGTLPQTFGVDIHGLVYVSGSVSVISSRSRFGLGRLYRSSRTAFSLIGKPNASTHIRSSRPTVLTTSVSPCHVPTE